MKRLNEYISEKLTINKDFDTTAEYRKDNGEIEIENYESFKYWLDDNNIKYEILDLKDSRNQFGDDAKFLISISLDEKVNKDVSLVYAFIGKGEYFWHYFVGKDLVYDRSSSNDLYSGDDAFKEWLQRRRRPIQYFNEKIKSCNKKRAACLKPKRDRRTGDYTTDYYGAQQQEAWMKKYENIIERMK